MGIGLVSEPQPKKCKHVDIWQNDNVRELEHQWYLRLTTFTQLNANITLQLALMYLK